MGSFPAFRLAMRTPRITFVAVRAMCVTRYRRRGERAKTGEVFPCAACRQAVRSVWPVYVFLAWPRRWFHPGRRGPSRRLPYGNGMRSALDGLHAFLIHLRAFSDSKAHARASIIALTSDPVVEQWGCSEAFLSTLFAHSMRSLATRPRGTQRANEQRLLAQLCGLRPEQVRELAKERKPETLAKLRQNKSTSLFKKPMGELGQNRRDD